MAKKYTVNDIINSDELLITAQQAADAMGVNPQYLRDALRKNPDYLGFSVVRSGTHVHIPRIPFLKRFGVDVTYTPSPRKGA